MPEQWFQVVDLDKIPSPALLVYPARVDENIRRVVDMVGDPARLRPHVKTHKMPELIRRQLAVGITKFKVATIAEAEMVAQTGGKDILLAYQPIGPNIDRLKRLIAKFPDVRFASVVDSLEVVKTLNTAFEDEAKPLDVYLDLDCGMHRTGIEPGRRALDLYRQIHESKGLNASGLHAYDGHNHIEDIDKRTEQCEVEFQVVRALAEELSSEGLPVAELVASGSPTFPIHAQHADVTCSPGTVFFWDYGYGTHFPDMNFLLAAIVITRVISKPGPNRVCVDLGHKAIAAENPHPRVRFLNLMDAEAAMQSEEHLVLESVNADELEIGDVLYGVPRHICPTVALYSHAYTIQEGHLTGEWEITARERRITV